MPISFWKDVDAEADALVDLSTLKKRYISDGIMVAERLAIDENVLGVWLSGPFTLARVSRQSDLHMGILLNRGEERYYRHQFAEFNETGRRLEMGFFPTNYFAPILDKGFRSWVDVFDVHKLSEMEILYDKDNALADIRGQLAKLKPWPPFIGRQIESIRLNLIRFKRYLINGDNSAGILISRKIVTDSLKLLTLIAHNYTFSKTSHLSMALGSSPGSSVHKLFHRAHGLSQLDGKSTAVIVRKTSEFVQYLFDRCIHCGDHLN